MTIAGIVSDMRSEIVEMNFDRGFRAMEAIVTDGPANPQQQQYKQQLRDYSRSGRLWFDNSVRDGGEATIKPP